MKHIKLFEQFVLNEWSEGDIDDIQSHIRKTCGDYETLHYGFDYLEVRLNNREDEDSIQECLSYLLKKFDSVISEIDSEETGWFKIYFKKDSELKESSNEVPKFYHGSTDNKLEGKNGIHIGTYKAAKEALEARIGVPATGEWDGTKEYGKTLLAGKKTINRIETEEKRYVGTGFNCGKDMPEEDYYPVDRKEKAKYSDGTVIPENCKPIIFEVKIVGPMTNSMNTPHKDFVANGLMMRAIRKGNPKSGFFYKNVAEDVDSISAVVPNKSFLEIV